MTINRTTLLDLPLPVTGTESGVWGDVVNNGLSQYIDISVAGSLSLSADSDTNLSSTEGDASATNIGSTTAQYAILRCTGARTATRNINAPAWAISGGTLTNYSKIYIVVNETTGSQNIVLRATNSATPTYTTGVTIVPGERAVCAWNGSDFVKVGGAAGGSTTQVQFNNAGVFGGITNATTDGTTLSMTSPKVITSINDTNGNELFKVTATGSAVNEFTVANAATGAGPTLSATGSDTNIAINLTPKGSGQVTVTNDALVNTVRVGLGAGAVSTNTAVGVSALAANSTGSLNTAVGYQAGYSNTTGTDNAFLGHLSGYSNTTASGNTGVGRLALYSNQTGTDNTAHGREALKNTTGSNNTAVGSNALVTNTTGDNNTAVGHVAFASNTTGSNSVAVGMYAGNSHTTGARNTFVGGQAGRYTTSATDNVAMGYTSLWANTTGLYNVAVGVDALRSNTTASNNTAVGYQAGYSNTTAGGNTIMGYQALYSNTTGANNVAVGYAALDACTTGANNTAVGTNALGGLTNSNANVAIGNGTGANITTGAGNTIIGEGAVPNAATDGFTVLIGRLNGNNIVGKGDSTAFISANSGATYNGKNITTWDTVSDSRLKKNIVDNNEGIDVISQIRVRNFEYRTPDEVTELPSNQAVVKSGIQLGVIAQELQQVCPDCVEEQSTGVLSVNTDEIFWHMVNAIKELNTRLQAAEAEIATLKGA